MSRVLKVLTIWFLMGMVYFVIEGIWRIPKGGDANISMLFVGGLCGLLIGSINQIPKFYNMSVFKQSLIGTGIVLVIEYTAGYILNIKMGLDIWDYSNMFFNINGQICLEFGLLWLLIMPAAIWLEDFIRFKFWNEGAEYGIKDVYMEFLGLR